MHYWCLLFLVVVVAAKSAMKECELDKPFTDKSCKSDADLKCDVKPECKCPLKSKCIKTKLTSGSETCQYRCQSDWVENLIEKSVEKYDTGPVRK